MPTTKLPYDRLAPTSPTAPPVLIEPPGALTGGRHEVWIAAAGPTGWGGAEVWASLNDQSYEKIGMIGRGCVIGQLATALPAAGDPDTVSSANIDVAASNGVLYPGAPSDADLYTTICWTDGELFSYSAATLVGPHLYQLHTRLRRGVFGSIVKHHPAGAPFARLNGAVFRHQYPAHFIGQTIYVKLPACNEHYQWQQGLDVVSAYSLVLTGASAK
jgi:hypothetical protein